MPIPIAKNTIVGTNLYGKMTKCAESISTIAPAKIEPVIRNNIGTAKLELFFAFSINPIVSGNNPTRNNIKA